MKSIFILTSLLLLSSVHLSEAQSTLLLLNGKERIIKDYEVKGENIIYKKPKDDKGDHHKMDKYGVFSVTDSTGKEDIIYNPFDTVEDLSPERMRLFIKGQQFSREHYRPSFLIKGESFVVGAAGGMLAIYGTPIPFLNAILMGQHTPKTVHTANDPSYWSDEDFQFGFKYRARKKRIEQSLIWGGIGFGVGITTFILIYTNK